MSDVIICKIPELNIETHTGRVPWKHWLLFYLTAVHTWTGEIVGKLHSEGWDEDCKAKRDWVHSLVKERWENKRHSERLDPQRQPNRLLLQKGFSVWTTKDHKVFSQSGLDINTSRRAKTGESTAHGVFSSTKIFAFLYNLYRTINHFYRHLKFL